MQVLPYIADRRDVTDATQLIRDFGAAAGIEAAMRAHAGRESGNVRSFCRWRQIERLIAVLDDGKAVGRLH